MSFLTSSSSFSIKTNCSRNPLPVFLSLISSVSGLYPKNLPMKQSAVSTPSLSSHSAFWNFAGLPYRKQLRIRLLQLYGINRSLYKNNIARMDIRVHPDTLRYHLCHLNPHLAYIVTPSVNFPLLLNVRRHM